LFATGAGVGDGFGPFPGQDIFTFNVFSLQSDSNGVASASIALRNTEYTFAVTSPSAVPIPAAAWLFGTAILGMAGVARRKKT
jgi:hypothetical protein